MDTVAQLLAHLPTPLLDDSTKIRAALHAISLQVHQAAPASLRPDLLAALKTAGVASLKNRQAAANHVCRALRERQAVDAAADQGSSHAAVRPGCGRVRLLLHPTASGRVAASVRVGVDQSFAIVGAYATDAVRTALLRRGWRQEEAPHRASLLWTRKASDVIDGTLPPSSQLRNHFRNTAELVTKRGLASNLRMLAALDGVDVRSVAPASYCLADPKQLAEFLGTEWCQQQKAAAGFGATSPGFGAACPSFGATSPDGGDAPPQRAALTAAAAAATSAAWIVKPDGGRRGQGITIVTELEPLLERCRDERFRLVVQQYVASPRLVHGRKFDMRVWALVTSFNPLVWWKYDDYYLRFASAPYGSGGGFDPAAHLTNHCVQVGVAGYGSFAEGNMWSREQFIAHLASEREGLQDERADRSRAEADEAALGVAVRALLGTALRAVADVVEPAPGGFSFELFGFDVLLDAELRPWLLEANSSPSMARDAPPLRRMVDHALDDLLDVVLALHVGGRSVAEVAAERSAAVGRAGPCWRLASGGGDLEHSRPWSESELRARRFAKDCEHGGAAAPRTPQAVLREWCSSSTPCEDGRCGAALECN